jgi:hypothetical protein
LGVRCPSEKDCAEQRKKYSVYPIRDGEKVIKKARSSDKKGAHDGTRTNVGMSKRLDLHSKEQESTSHQAALVIGGINLINTRTCANMQGGKHGDLRAKMPKGAAATARAKGGVEGWRAYGHTHKQRAEQINTRTRAEQRTASQSQRREERKYWGEVPTNKRHGECRGRHPTGRYGPNGEG